MYVPLSLHPTVFDISTSHAIDITAPKYSFASLAPDTPGEDGTVSTSAIHSGTLDAASKQRFPLALLKVMKRRTEDLLLSDADTDAGNAALTFIFDVAREKTGTAAERLAKGMFVVQYDAIKYSSLKARCTATRAAPLRF